MHLLHQVQVSPLHCNVVSLLKNNSYVCDTSVLHTLSTCHIKERAIVVLKDTIELLAHTQN